MLGQGGKVRYERDSRMRGAELGPLARSDAGELRLSFSCVRKANVGTEFHNDPAFVTSGHLLRGWGLAANHRHGNLAQDVRCTVVARSSFSTEAVLPMYDVTNYGRYRRGKRFAAIFVKGYF